MRGWRITSASVSVPFRVYGCGCHTDKSVYFESVWRSIALRGRRQREIVRARVIRMHIGFLWWFQWHTEGMVFIVYSAQHFDHRRVLNGGPANTWHACLYIYLRVSVLLLGFRVLPDVGEKMFISLSFNLTFASVYIHECQPNALRVDAKSTFEMSLWKGHFRECVCVCVCAVDSNLM